MHEHLIEQILQPLRQSTFDALRSLQLDLAPSSGFAPQEEEAAPTPAGLAPTALAGAVAASVSAATAAASTAHGLGSAQQASPAIPLAAPLQSTWHADTALPAPASHLAAPPAENPGATAAPRWVRTKPRATDRTRSDSVSGPAPRLNTTTSASAANPINAATSTSASGLSGSTNQSSSTSQSAGLVINAANAAVKPAIENGIDSKISQNSSPGATSALNASAAQTSFSAPPFQQIAPIPSMPPIAPVSASGIKTTTLIRNGVVLAEPESTSLPMPLPPLANMPQAASMSQQLPSSAPPPAVAGNPGLHQLAPAPAAGPMATVVNSMHGSAPTSAPNQPAPLSSKPLPPGLPVLARRLDKVMQTMLPQLAAAAYPQAPSALAGSVASMGSALDDVDAGNDTGITANSRARPDASANNFNSGNRINGINGINGINNSGGSGFEQAVNNTFNLNLNLAANQRFEAADLDQVRAVLLQTLVDSARRHGIEP